MEYKLLTIISTLFLQSLFRDGNCSGLHQLGGVFTRIPNVGTNIFSGPYKTNRATSTCVECALVCLMDRIGVTSPACVAFSCLPLTLDCDFYDSPGMTHSPPIDAVLYVYYTDTDPTTFHRVFVGDRPYAIHISASTATYINARLQCLSMGGHLLHIDSLDKYQAVQTVKEEQGLSHPFSFVGANDIVLEGEWILDRDGTAIDTSVWIWAAGEPDNRGANEHCAYMDLWIYKLKDIDCNQYRMTYICEKNV